MSLEGGVPHACNSGDLTNDSSYFQSVDPNAISKKRKREPIIDCDGGIDYRITPLPQPTPDHICQRCNELEFEKAIDVDMEGLSFVLIADVGNRFRQPPGTYLCSLCRLISTTRIQEPVPYNNWQDSGKGDRLYAFPSLELVCDVSPKENGYCRNNIAHNNSYTMALIPFGYEYNNGFRDQLITQFTENERIILYKRLIDPPALLAGHPVSRQFNPHLISDWLKYCRKHHKICRAKKRSTLPGFRLIDCHTNRVVLGSDNHQYIALSYVWGSHQDEAQASDTSTLPDTLAAVIQDAIEVTRALGLRYIWVDKYCIDQNNAAVKHEQISAMDTIYAGAELTIIAAAGQDEKFGLPGLRSKLRRSQFAVTIRDVSLISTMAHPHTSIQASKWSTRGWTYQEAVLSRRRLVFTEDQVYFECNAMNCYESVQSKLDLIHCKDKSKFRQFMRTGIFNGGLSHGFGRFDVRNLGQDASFIRYLSHIENYTARTLSFESDSLVAFTGISRHFETLKHPITQVAGIPCPKLCLLNPTPDREYCRYLADSLCWNHKKVQSSGSLPYRRKGFPSWSWSGWAGAVEYRERGYTAVSTYDILSGPNQILFGGGINPSSSVVNLGQYSDASKQEAKSCCPTTLHLWTGAIPVAAFQFEHTVGLTVFGFSATVFMSSEPFLVEEVFEGLKNSKFKCLVMGSVGAQGNMLVVELNGGMAQRIGLMRVIGYDKTIPGGYLFEYLVDLEIERFFIL